MINIKELKKEIKATEQAKKQENYYDELDKWALFGYLHALKYVEGTLKPRNKE